MVLILLAEIAVRLSLCNIKVMNPYDFKHSLLISSSCPGSEVTLGLGGGDEIRSTDSRK
jgi:hypothetical protein